MHSIIQLGKLGASFMDNLRGIVGLKSILVPMIWACLILNSLELITGVLAYSDNSSIQSELIPGYNIFGSVQLISIGFTILTIFVFGRWVWVASKNLWDHYVLNYSPASNIWWHAIPIMSLFKPFDAMREIWTRSMGVSESYSDETPTHLKIWWGGWVVSSIASNIAFRISNDYADTLFQIIAAAATAIACYFVIQIVTEITDAQAKGIGGISEIFA